MYVQTDENGRITATTERVEFADDSMFEFDFPDGFDFSEQNDYTIIDGNLAHDPAPKPPYVEMAELKANLAATDYVAVKIAEYKATGDELPEGDAERYAGIIEQRREWRSRINELEANHGV